MRQPCVALGTWSLTHRTCSPRTNNINLGLPPFVTRFVTLRKIRSGALPFVATFVTHILNLIPRRPPFVSPFVSRAPNCTHRGRHSFPIRYACRPSPPLWAIKHVLWTVEHVLWLLARRALWPRDTYFGTCILDHRTLLFCGPYQRNLGSIRIWAMEHTTCSMDYRTFAMDHRKHRTCSIGP